MVFQKFMNYVFENYSALEDHPCNLECDDCKKSCVDCHIERYRGWKGGRPRYKCTNIKRVYLQRYLAAHVAQTKSVIEKTILGAIRILDTVKAASFGGGPGVECIALSDLLNDIGCQKLRFRSFDIEDSWQAYFNDLSETFGKMLDNLSLDSRFIHQNILKRPTDARYHVVFVPWVLSELDTGTIPAFVNSAISACETGGHVVVLERKESNLGQIIVDTFKDIEGVSRIFPSENSVDGWCGISFDDDHKNRFKVQLNYQSLYYVFQRS